MNERVEFDYLERRQKRIGLNVLSLAVFATLVGSVSIAAAALSLKDTSFLWAIAGGLVVAAYLAVAPRVANQWENAVVLRLGKYVGLRGPGLFWIIPLIDRTVMWIDLRVRTTGFAAEKTLTSDTVPVNVDAVLFWAVKDSQKAALAVQDYREAVAWAAQTALRDVIGKTDLATMLVGREHIDEELQTLIDARTHDWGITVNSVEIRDVVIPPALEEAMSRQAQAEREKQARVILGDAEVEIAEKFLVASDTYRGNATALQLRSLNLLYEGMKEKGTLMVVPTTMVESTGIGAFAGLAAIGAKDDGSDKPSSG
ncbi:MAG: slipin family protein [Acidobacteriota bacterium]